MWGKSSRPMAKLSSPLYATINGHAASFGDRLGAEVCKQIGVRKQHVTRLTSHSR